MDEINKIEEDINNKNAVEERFKNLVGGKKEAEAKAEEALKGKAESDAKLATLEKETSFLNSFSDVTAKFPTASEFKDKIRDKVMSGYSVDDATVSTLVAEGKYTAPQALRETVAGGSAPNQIIGGGIKPVAEMNKEERWSALREAEKRGEIGMQ